MSRDDLINEQGAYEASLGDLFKAIPRLAQVPPTPQNATMLATQLGVVAWRLFADKLPPDKGKFLRTLVLTYPKQVTVTAAIGMDPVKGMFDVVAENVRLQRLLDDNGIKYD